MQVAPPTLPVVVLRDRSIDPAVLRHIPLLTMKKFQVAAFEESESELKLAVVYPEQLKQGFYIAIKDMGKKIQRQITLYKTDPASFRYLVGKYPVEVNSAAPTPVKKDSLLPPPPLPPDIPDLPPPLFRVGKSVAFNYLKRVPIDYAKEHRLLCVDFLPPNTAWFATDQDSENTKKLIPLIEETNNIRIHLVYLNKSEINDLLGYYTMLLKQESGEERESEANAEAATIAAREKRQKEVEALEQKRKSEMAAALPETRMAADVTVPEVQAAIISKEDEQPGIAGFFHRLGQSMSQPKAEQVIKEPEDRIPPKTPEKEAKPENNAPSTGVSSRSAAEPMQVTKIDAKSAEAVTEAKEKEKKAANPVSDEDGDIGKLLEGEVSTLEQLKEHVRKGFIPRIVAAAVSFAIHEKASDIHLEAFDDEVRIRFRVDGQLMDVIKLPPDLHAAIVSRIKILSRLRLDETRVPQDGRFDVNFDHAQVDLRVSVMPTVHGEKVVMRILDKGKGITSLEQLGIEGQAYQNLTKAIQKPFGVCLATGPTGSGKSTTLYAILNRIATPNVNVVTLEDPVEYEMKGINQSQIRPKIGFTFAEGLRSVLRQDPNIIMVGEIRDGETANMATQAALTGHLVLSTLHTNDAAGAIPRLTNMGIEPFLIASSLNMAIGQRLVRKICPNCKRKVSLPAGFRAQMEADLASIERVNPLDAKRLKKPYTFYQGMGCEQCGGKGYQGRVGIYEVILMTEAIEDLTLAHAANIKIQEESQRQGMLTMYQDGLLKVINGVTTLDEVLRETTNK